jgi:lysosomal acid lipase/cholesteryl ester hydrolase
VHGLQDSADAWIVNDNDSPAMQLVKAGYDVWLANLRGNKYSKKHISLDIKSAEFWNFGWEEVALYDLPAITEFV